MRIGLIALVIGGGLLSGCYYYGPYYPGDYPYYSTYYSHVRYCPYYWHGRCYPHRVWRLGHWYYY